MFTCILGGNFGLQKPEEAMHFRKCKFYVDCAEKGCSQSYQNTILKYIKG